MKDLALARRLRRHLAPIVAVSALAVAVSAPGTHWLVGRAELERRARADAARVAAIVREVVQQRPRLWRYDAAKLREHLSYQGLGFLDALDIRDERNARVLEIGAAQGGRLWALSEVLVDGAVVASVWVGASTQHLKEDTAFLAAAFLALAVPLALLLYLLPSRSIARAERQISELMTQMALSREEQERRRIARELHDGAGQALTAARLQLIALRAKAGIDAEALNAALEHLDEALDEVRRCTTELLPPSLSELGLCGALARHCEAFAEATGMRISFRGPEPPPDLPPAVELACFRIAQEALHNAAKHSGARQVTVALSMGDGLLQLDVDGDGEQARIDPSAGAGLRSIRERVSLLGGEVELSPSMRMMRVSIPVRG